MRFCWQQHVVYCVPKTPIPSPRFVLSTTLSPSLRSCSRLLFPRGTPVTCKEKSLPCRRIAAKTPHRQIPDPTPAPVQNPALSRDRQHPPIVLINSYLGDTLFACGTVRQTAATIGITEGVSVGPGDKTGEIRYGAVMAKSTRTGCPEAFDQRPGISSHPGAADESTGSHHRTS